jgi:hypothetical protein
MPAGLDYGYLLTRRRVLATICSFGCRECNPRSVQPILNALCTLIMQAIENPLQADEECKFEVLGLARQCLGRELFRSTDGHFGLGPGCAEPGRHPLSGVNKIT